MTLDFFRVIYIANLNKMCYIHTKFRTMKSNNIKYLFYLAAIATGAYLVDNTIDFVNSDFDFSAYTKDGTSSLVIRLAGFIASLAYSIHYLRKDLSKSKG